MHMWYNYSMDTSRNPESIQDRSLLPLTNYTDSWNVRARFLLNEFARDPKDIEALAYVGSNTTQTQRLLDVGAADGAFFERLAFEFLHTGEMFAVDINPEQFLRRNYPTFTNEHIRGGVKEFKVFDALLRNLPIDVTQLKFEDDEEQTATAYHRLAGDVSNLEFPDKSFDTVFALFMLYHVPDSEREGALVEIKRVLKDEGVFVMASSGSNNKENHRVYEGKIAKKLGVEPPVRMNFGFTTEKAIEIIPKHFKHVFVLSQETEMVIKTDFEIAAYIASQVSLYNQYTPIPPKEDFQTQMTALEEEIRSIIAVDGEFIDTISRSIIIGTDDSSFVPGDPGFIPLITIT